MGATIVRQWLVLSMLPRPPRSIDTASIASRLRERGIEVHRRTLQRDLIELATVFPIVADERAKPYGWRWAEGAQGIGQVPTPPNPINTRFIDVSLRVQKTKLARVVELLRGRNERVSSGSSEDGFVIAVVAIEDSDDARRRLLGHADEVEVVAPLNLRQEIAERACRALTAHR
jgi:predicted DNA-binding transcriptional regulator YafY